MKFNTSSVLAFCLLAYVHISTSANAAGWGVSESTDHGDWSDYTEASPDIYPDGWQISALADFEGHEIQLRSSGGALLRWLDVEQIKTLHKVHLEIQQVAEARATLYITRGETPNASAGIRDGRNTIFVNFAMFDMVQGDADLWAALMGHELAHLKLGHGESQAKKNLPLNILKSVGTAVLNNPLANIASSTLLDSVTAKFSRDDERQSDYMGVIWAIESNYDPYGAVELHRKMAELGRGHPLPFLSTHPSSPERIENLESLADRLTDKSEPQG